MPEVGDEQAGFAVEFHRETNTIRVRAWGFWGVEVAKQFCDVVLAESAMSQRGAVMTMDMRNLKPMRDEGQQSFAKLVAALRTMRVNEVSVQTKSPLTKLQLQRIVTEQHGQDQVQFV